MLLTTPTFRLQPPRLMPCDTTPSLALRESACDTGWCSIESIWYKLACWAVASGGPTWTATVVGSEVGLDQQPVFVNSLRGHRHAYLFTYCLWLFSHYSHRAEYSSACKPRICTIWPSKKMLAHPLTYSAVPAPFYPTPGLVPSCPAPQAPHHWLSQAECSPHLGTQTLGTTTSHLITTAFSGKKGK